MREDAGSFIGAMVCIALGVCGLVAWAIATGDYDAPKRAVTDAGYRDPKIGPSSALGSWHGCAEDEVAWPVSATNVRDERVKLTVCCGAILKGCTIRH